MGNYPTVKEVMKDNQRLRRYHLTWKKKSADSAAWKAYKLERAADRCHRDSCLKMAQWYFMQGDVESWNTCLKDAATFGKLTKRMIAVTTSYVKYEEVMENRLRAAKIKEEHPDAIIKWESWDHFTVQYPVMKKESPITLVMMESLRRVDEQRATRIELERAKEEIERVGRQQNSPQLAMDETRVEWESRTDGI